MDCLNVEKYKFSMKYAYKAWKIYISEKDIQNQKDSEFTM